ncbi:MAG TPA: hypothetical protein VFJ16_01655 [Longimicrobium sp.]|nr:hypothetical protein [Longimicrobium sp.]
MFDLKSDIVGAYQRALAIIRWISPAKASWVVRQWPALQILPLRPCAPTRPART